MQSIAFLAVFLAGLTLSAILTPIVRKVAHLTGQIAMPKDSRWHRKETALLGGVSIFTAMTGVWIAAVGSMGWDAFGRPYLPMILCAAAMFALGLADDLFNMDPQHKLAGQIVIAAASIFLGFRLGWTESKTFNLFLSFLWIVGVTNAFNLLDNMDGLAGGIAFIGGAFLFLWHFQSSVDQRVAAGALVICSAYLGAILGFLIYNFNPASIFMGDAGSLFIGFVLACLTIVGPAERAGGSGFVHLLSVIAIPILIVFIPILDTGFVSLMRKSFRRPISQGGKDHSSHRMVAIGLSERRAVVVLYAFAAASGMIGLALRYLDLWTGLALIVLYLLFVVLFWTYLGKVKVYPEKSWLSEESSSFITPILVEITYRRRLFEVLLDSVLISVAYYISYLLRFEGTIGPNFPFFLRSLPVVIACQIFGLFLAGVYRGVWESTSLRDLMGYVKAASVGTVLPVLLLLGLYRFESFSRAVFGIYWFLMLIFISLSRFSFRLIDEGVGRAGQKGRHTIIYGAGIGGQMLIKEIETNKALGLKLVGLVDDNSRLHGRRVMGYPVLGGQKDLEEVIKEHQVKEVIVSFKENGAERKREIKDLCVRKGLEVEVRRMNLTIT